MERYMKIFDTVNADCAMITSDVNRRYFTGMKSSAGILLVFPSKAYLIIDFRYIEKARETVKNAEVIEMEKPNEQIAELLKKHNAVSMAVESEKMTVKTLNKYNDFFKDIEIDSSDSLSNAINALRAVKSPHETECIRKAQEIAEKSLDELLPFIKVGRTERETANELNRLMFKNGAEDLSFETIVLSGKNTSMPHGVPSDKKICDGEFLLMDFGAVFQGYHSDMTRTFCIGKPTEEMEKVYNIVLNAQLLAIQSARCGISGKELDTVARDFIVKNGYGENFGHSLGHGVGLEIHENPNASQNNDTPLEKGSVITIEPGIYIQGKFGVRIEDFVILTENGCDNLTKYAKNIISL